MLKSLEMFGFKSFADRTRFDFAPGVTGVVGPNGSGKSNVVDSIKWILGDQSPKSLRGKEMTDVIFNGSGGRKPAGFAEATLTFDNSKRVLAVDMDDVQIGRRIYRSGEAEYLINRVPARLKDVRDLFLGTGAGTSAYSIIEQGRVDQLLQATTVNRRIVFEEAAGISRFKMKKVDAQRKLERVGQNLLRLTDIVQEVEGQLNTLRSQATKAAKFREISGELKTLRIGLAADDYRELSARLTGIEGERTTLQSQIEQLAVEAGDSESRQQSADRQVAEVEDQLRAAERRESENRESIAGQEATVRHQQSRQQELHAEFARLEKQQLELAARSQQVAGELEQTVDHLQKFAEELEQRKAGLSAAEEAIRASSEEATQARDRVERQRGELLESVRQASVLGNRVTTIAAQIEVLQAAHDRAGQRRVRLESDLAACQEELLRRQASVQAETERLSSLRDELREVQAWRYEVLLQQGESQQRLLDLREQRSAVQARRNLLEDLEQRQEGLGVGVKEILARARGAEGPPWDCVLGHVVELLEVDLENAALIEVALGNRAQLIVLDDARPLLGFLSDGTCQISGRVGFLAISPEEQTNDPSLGGEGFDLSGCAGVVSRADRLVRSASGIHRLAEQLLSDTWVVSTLEVALTLAAGTAERCRFVTLQGELLEGNGTLYVGAVRSETSLISRKSELRGIKGDLQRLERQIAGEEDALARIAADLRAHDAEEQRLQAEADEATQRLSELKSAAGSQELDRERLERSRTEIDADLTTSAGDLERLHPQAAAARDELSLFEAELQELQTAIRKGEADVSVQEERQQELHGRYATEQRNLAQQEERLHNLQDTRSRLDEERYQRDLHREEAERRFQLLATKREQIDLEILNTNAVLVELVARKQELAGDVARLQAEREQARRLRSEMAEQELQQRHRLRDLKEQLHAFEIQASEIRHQVVNLVDRLRDEYQVELQEIAASGVSARQQHLDSIQRSATTGTETIGEAIPPSSPVNLDGGAVGDMGDGEQRPSATTVAGSVREIVEEQVNRLRRKLKQLGQVNTDSLTELDEMESRYARLSGQLQDLVEARSTLEEIIRRIDGESKRMFSETFNEIRKHFQELFRKLFGGGEGDVVLEDPEDILDCGIDVVARPPGKELRSISLLSGGEKTMTAVALLLAIFKSRPSPFCILDEVDAALDEGNVDRYLGVIREFQQWTQFIVITHSKRTMSGADVLYGVTMEEAGVSKRMSVRFDDISADGQIRTTSPGKSAA